MASSIAELTSFKFEFTAQNVHQELDNCIHRGQSVREEQESNHDGLFFVETEGLVQRVVVYEGREESEDVEHVGLLKLASILRVAQSWTYLSNEKQLSSVAKTPVTKLMSQDGNNLLRLALLNQSIVDNNVLFPRKTIEVGIAVSAALATVDDIQLVKREVQLLSQILNTSLQFARFKR